MSDLPYTDEQADIIRRATGGMLSYGEPKTLLRYLHQAGITVTFPEPRYYVDGDKAPYDVMDRVMGAGVARFWRHMDNNGRDYAQEHADRLNREDHA